MNDQSTRLFAIPDFAQGVGSLFDVFGTLNQYNNAESPEEADYEALRSDWQAIGDDLRQAMQTVAPDAQA